MAHKSNKNLIIAIVIIALVAAGGFVLTQTNGLFFKGSFTKSISSKIKLPKSTPVFQINQNENLPLLIAELHPENPAGGSITQYHAAVLKFNLYSPDQTYIANSLTFEKHQPDGELNTSLTVWADSWDVYYSQNEPEKARGFTTDPSGNAVDETITVPLTTALYIPQGTTRTVILVASVFIPSNTPGPNTRSMKFKLKGVSPAVVASGFDTIVGNTFTKTQ